jgi:hypothetical protein
LDGTQPYLSASWPNIQDFVYGRRADGLEYDCDAAVLRRWVVRLDSGRFPRRKRIA